MLTAVTWIGILAALDSPILKHLKPPSLSVGSTSDLSGTI